MRNTITASLLLACSLTAQNADGEPLAKIDGRLGLDFTSNYFFRGIIQEDQGLIAQPWLNLGFDLLEGGEKLPALKLVTGVWNSLDSGPSGTDGNTSVWYESRFHFGLETQLGERLHAGARYNAYANPNGSARWAPVGTVDELAFYANYDDKNQLIEGLALNPHVLFAHELEGQRDGGNHRGNYLEVGVEPRFEIGSIGSSAVTLSTPATLGFGLGDYYERATGGGADFLGFMQVGAVAHVPVGCSPERCGPLMFDCGVHLIVLGDNQESRNDGDLTSIFFTMGFSTAF